MKPIDTLITNARILTMDPQDRTLDDGFIAISRGKIVGIGPASERPRSSAAQEILDARRNLVMPGLIDTHLHVTQQLLRGSVQELLSVRGWKAPGWIYYIIGFESLLSEAESHLSALATFANLLKVGTTCFAEATTPHPDAVGRAMLETGLRGCLARSTMDVDMGYIPSNMLFETDEAITANVDLVQRWHGQGDGRIRAWFGLQEILSCSEALFKAFGELSHQYGTRIHVHLAGSIDEVEYCTTKYGRRVAEHLEDIGFMSPRVHAAHSVFLADHEVDIYARNDVSVAHCPSTNFVFMGAPKVPQMRRSGIRVGIGSDGSAFGSLDLFEEMNISWVVQCSHFGVPYHVRPLIDYRDVWRMATINSAEALGWDGEIGSLEVGKRADLIILDLDSLTVLPIQGDLRFAVARRLNGNSVLTTMVDGQVLMKDRQLTTIDEDWLKAELRLRVPPIMERYFAGLPD